ncbi:hypothetical protein GCM10009796_20210 [Microbacterium koreense]
MGVHSEAGGREKREARWAVQPVRSHAPAHMTRHDGPEASGMPRVAARLKPYRPRGARGDSAADRAKLSALSPPRATVFA